MAKDKIATSLPKCASCKCDVGAEVGIIPFFVDDCARESSEKAKHEAFCPRCFVYVRSPREPDRFRPGTFLPVACAKCGKQSVAIGSDSCMQCGSRNVVMLPPQPGVA
jgi:hypothetical protein